ncbi:MAG: GNAT family N-acetyltransferase [Desulfatitalea sp.]|nr:GNAT family N-acetyltransferase [Desulfatitalea sp.]
MAYEVLLADLKKDKNDILAFWNGFHKKSLDLKLDWIYFNNPDGFPNLFKVIHVASGKIAGMTTLFPRTFYINGVEMRSAVAGDFLVHPAHRMLGPAIMLQRNTLKYAKDGKFDFLYGFPNTTAEVVMSRIGYRVVGQRVRMTKILKSKNRLKEKKIAGFSLRFAAPQVDLGLKLLSGETLTRQCTRYICRYINEIDERFDDFNDAIRKNGIIVGQRNAQFVRWKYFQDPDEQHAIFGVFTKDESRLLGYIVFTIKKKKVEVRDFVLPADQYSSRCLLKAMIMNLRKDGIESIGFCFLENKAAVSLLKFFGFFKRDDDRRIYVYFNGQKFTDTLMLNPENWFLTIGDQDT